MAEAEPAAATLAKFMPFCVELPSLSRLHMVLSELNREYVNGVLVLLVVASASLDTWASGWASAGLLLRAAFTRGTDATGTVTVVLTDACTKALLKCVVMLGGADDIGGGR